MQRETFHSKEIMSVVCIYCKSKFSTCSGLERHQPKSARCDRKVLKNILLCNSGKCSFNCRVRTFKNEASLMNHYKFNCLNISISQRTLLFPFSNANENNDENHDENFVNNDNDETTQTLSSAEKILLSRNLKLYRQYGLIKCLRCNTLHGKRYLDHSRITHKMPLLSRAEKKTISEHVDPLINSSPYFNRSMELLEPIQFIESISGFRCTICPYYCRNEKSSKMHVKLHEGNVEMAPCFVQTIANEESRKRIYFGINSPVSTSEPSNNSNMDAIRILRSAQDQLVSRVRLTPKVNRFYEKLCWWHDADVDNLCKNDFRGLVEIPVDGSDPRIIFNLVKAEYVGLIKNIGDISFSIRNIFASKDTNKALEPLKTAESYAFVFSKMINFFVKAKGNDIFGGIFDEEITTLLETIATGDFGPNSFNLIRLGMKMIQQPYSNCKGSFFNLFLKYNCLQADGSLLTCAEFERICSKLIYFCKLSLAYYIRHADELDINNNIELSRYLISAPHMSFASLCGFKSLSKSYNDSFSNVPKLISGAVDTEVWCNGDLISIYQIRNVYKNCLNNLEKVLKDLMFGLGLVDIEFSDNWNDISAGYGINTGNRSEFDYVLRSCLLVH